MGSGMASPRTVLLLDTELGLFLSWGVEFRALSVYT